MKRGVMGAVACLGAAGFLCVAALAVFVITGPQKPS